MSTIFLVDDVELFRELERAHLDGCGYRIETAASGEEALARLDEVQPDLMLLDVYMPGMDGMEVCRRIRASQRWARLPVIMVTAAGKESEIRACLAAGCDDYLTKPVTRKDLVEKVRRLLGQVQRRTAERRPVAMRVHVRSEGKSFVCEARNLSTNGIYLRGTPPLPVGTRVEVSIARPDGASTALLGKVKRISREQDGQGMGVYFILPDAEARRQVSALLESGRAQPAETPRGSLEEKVSWLEQRQQELETENQRLQMRVNELEEENQEFAERIVQVEELNNNLNNLYVASSRLHSVIDRLQVLDILKEIVINLVGAERFAILLLDRHRQCLNFQAGEGFTPAEFPSIAPGEGRLGEVFEARHIYLREGSLQHSSADLDDPLVAVPLIINGEAIGLLAIYALFIQKEQLKELDHQLFSMLAEHSATALFSATLFEESERKRATYKGFMDLLLK